MNNRLYTHIIEQPFVFATGLAALVHSTWSLGTLFSGEQPEASFSIEFAGWLLPAFLIAFAMDVGQIVTSSEIRAGHRTRAKYATFAVFAIATYYLQWLYIAHHMPMLELAGGVRGEWSGLATLVRDAAVWIIPAFLPLSTLMYTFSSDHEQPRPEAPAPAPSAPVVQIELPAVEALPEHIEPVVQPAPPQNAELQSLKLEIEDSELHIVRCESCGWTGQYASPSSARRALSTHQARYCSALHPVQVHQNGNGVHS